MNDISSDLDLLFDEAIETAIAGSKVKIHEIEVPKELIKESSKELDLDDNLYKIIGKLSIPQKIKLALLGNKTARQLMIKESNRIISLAVLDNARISEAEIESVAKDRNLDEMIYRKIARNSSWMKIYSIKCGLICNPRLPTDISMKWLKYLQDKDIKVLSKSKNIPQVVARAALKIHAQRQKSK